MSPGEDADAIDPDDLALRRIPDVWLVPDGDGHRASSQAFDNDSDGGPMSVYLDSVLTAHGLPRSSVIEGEEPGKFFVTGLRVATLLEQNQEVERDPIDPPERPCDVAHAGVRGSKNGKRRQRLARASMWVPGLCPPDAVGPMLDA